MLLPLLPLLESAFLFLPFFLLPSHPPYCFPTFQQKFIKLFQEVLILPLETFMILEPFGIIYMQKIDFVFSITLLAKKILSVLFGIGTMVIDLMFLR